MAQANVLLINPGVGEKSQSPRINAIVNNSFPTGLGVLAGCLLGDGLEQVDIVDEQVHPISDSDLPGLLNALAEPRIIGLGAYTINCGRAYEIAEKAKQIDPGCTVVVGGIHPTVVPDEPLSIQSIDVSVRGEAEETFSRLVSSILQGKEYRHLPGISFRGDDGFVHNPAAPLLRDLDKIPPFPYQLFAKDKENYPTFAAILGSRGCPYRCSFCSSRSISGTRFRHHSIDRVIHEITRLVREYGQESVHLMDDNIAVDRKHFGALCDAIVAAGLHKEAFFHGSMRGDNATDDVLDAAQKANFKILYFGLETGNERLMKAINKGETVAQVVEAIERASAKGFSVGATVILGLPSETRKERREIVRFVNRLPLGSVRFNTLTPYPGTPVYEEESPRGNVLVKGRWENFGVQYMWEGDDIPYVPEGSDRLGLIYDTMTANLRSYLSPKGIWRMLTQRYAGGNVIKLEKGWYTRWGESWRLISAFTYLITRFLNVAIRHFARSIVPRSSSRRS